MKKPQLPKQLRWWSVVLVASIVVLAILTLATFIIAYYLAFVEGPIEGVLGQELTAMLWDVIFYGIV